MINNFAGVYVIETIDTQMILEIELYSFGDPLEGTRFNEDSDKAWSFIKDIHFDVLKKDPVWHFFYEDSYSVIRFSSKFRKDLLEYLDERKIIHSKPVKWCDNSPIVEKYKEEYIQLFHIFTMFAIFAPIGDMTKVFDRVIHPFLNHSWYKLKDLRSSLGEAHWEATFIAENAINRAVHSGVILNQKEILRAYKVELAEKGAESDKKK